MDPIAAIGNVAGYVQAFEGLVRATVYVIGAILIIQSLRLAARRTEFGAQATSSVKVAATFLTGVALLAFPATVSVLQATLFGTAEIVGPDMIFSYGGGTLDQLTGAGAREAVAALVLIIQLVGFIAVARGLIFLNLAASPGGPRTFGSGMTFLIAGALAANFPLFYGVVARLFVT